MGRLNRPWVDQPGYPPAQAFKTYQIVAPRKTHFRLATCQEVGCAAYQNGWITALDERDPDSRNAAQWIRVKSGRHFVESRRADGTTQFVFKPEQQCFRPHQTRIDKPELYIVRGGDHRANPTQEVRRHTRPEHWVEDFAEHQDRIANQ